MQAVDSARIHALRAGEPGAGPVVYWMSRDQRAADNWALLLAQQRALAGGAPLAVVFCLSPAFPGATARSYAFMLCGLRETAGDLARRRIPFVLLRGDPAREVPAFARLHGAGLLVTDFDPLRVKMGWRLATAAALNIPVLEVDAHNVVPCRVASQKQEYGAYTLRPRVQRRLPDFLTPFPRLRRHPHAWPGRLPEPDWRAAFRSVNAAPGAAGRLAFTPGPAAARRRLSGFVRGRLAGYDIDRNDPCLDGQSGLSPYLHFGQLAPQRVALAARAAAVAGTARDSFLEELIVRRELSDNFCLYCRNYDRPSGFPEWARRTLGEHAGDRRPYRYSAEELEQAETHDALWNAAQRQMVFGGKMHGYLRMYWAKKILEWTTSAAAALELALRLNDAYELDGRDPSGYAGCAWAIGGVHDRAWPERPVFGKIRYMNDRGCRRKFDADAYIRGVDKQFG